MTSGIERECFINGVKYKCRTCFNPGQTFFSLTDECSKSKTWHDLLKAIVHQEENDEDLLPQNVCFRCSEKLKSSYDFILQIQDVNKRYSELLAESNSSLRSGDVNENNIADCLEESIIDLPWDQNSLEIKLETDFPDSFTIVSNANQVQECNEVKLENENLTEPEYFLVDIKNEKFKTTDSEHLGEKKKDSLKNRNQKLDDNDYINETSSSSSDESYYVTPKKSKKGKDNNSKSQPVQRKRGRKAPDYYDKIKEVNDRFVCLICQKTFSLKRDCGRHIATIHLPQTIFPCEICGKNFNHKVKIQQHVKRMHPDGKAHQSKRKNLSFGNRLYYKPSSWLLVQCKLCDTIFKTAKELRQHLSNHNSFDTLHSLELNSNIVQNFFGNKLDLNIVKESICKDIREENWFKYYKVLNKYSYEMSVSDTEAEDLDEETTKRVAKYKCDLCAEEFLFKYQVFSHFKEAHSENKFSLICNHCKLEFISKEMYEQHLKTHCENKDKILSCVNCPAKFVCPENLKNHNCITKPKFASSEHSKVKNLTVPTEIQQQNPSKNITYILPHQSKPNGCKRIKCMICFSEHNRIRDLRYHLQTHRYAVSFEKRKEIESMEDISSQLYPEDPVPLTEEVLIKRIGSDIKNEIKIERFYSITNENGYEISLDSSETESDSDDDNAEKNDKLKRVYRCDLCPQLSFNRKYKLFAHQNNKHTSDEACHICEHCNRRFLSSYILQLHYKNQCKNTQKIHFCRHCPQRFMWQSNLKAHVLIEHEVDRSLECFLCQKKYIPRKDFKRHLLTHHSADAELHYCLLCPKTFFSVDYLNDHLSRHRLTTADVDTIESIIHSTCWPNGEKIIKCKICDQTFETMASLKDHFSPRNTQNACANQHSLKSYSATNQKGFELHLELDSETELEDDVEHKNGHTNMIFSYNCYMCSTSFKRKYQVAQHQRSMHKYEMLALKCERCIFRTVSQKALDYHKSTQCFNAEKQFECHQCKFKFMWQENLENHISTFHTLKNNNKDANNAEISLPNETIQTKRKADTNIFECMHCNRRYNRKSSYKTHFKKFHDNELQSTPKKNVSSSKNLKQPAQKTEKKFLCTFCGVSFSNNSNLTIHIRRHTGEKPFKCDFCVMAFPRSSDLQAHRRSHTGERPFKCKYCDKSFSRQCKLKYHERIHTGERPYQCTFCLKSFIKSDYLKLHMRRHTDEKPYVCNTCGEDFICATSLKQHRNSNGH